MHHIAASVFGLVHGTIGHPRQFDLIAAVVGVDRCAHATRDVQDQRGKLATAAKMGAGDTAVGC